jgi:hypothetical protein
MFLADFIYMCDKIEEIHPNVFNKLSLIEYTCLKQEFVMRIEQECKNTTDLNFLLREFLAHLHDSHTGILTEPFDNNVCYPFTVFLSNQQFVVIMSEDESMLGYTIEKINGIPVDTIAKQMGKYIGFEQAIARNMYLTQCISNPMYYKYTNLTHQSDTIVLSLSNRSSYSVCAKKANDILWIADTTITVHPVSGYQEKNFFYRTFPKQNFTYLQLNEMIDKASELEDFYSRYNWVQRLIHKRQFKQYSRYRLFSNLLAKMFAEMENQQIKNLIVDLRYNGGGNSTVGDQLLFYLLPQQYDTLHLKYFQTGSRISKSVCDANSIVKKEYRRGHYGKITYGNIFWSTKNGILHEDIHNQKSVYHIADSTKRFTGKVYFIQGNNTFSAASDLLLKVYDNNLFTTVGEATAQSPTSFGDRFIFQLPFSKIACSVSWKYFIRPNHTDTSDILHPNIIIPSDYEELKKGNDKALEWILNEIRSGN